MTFDRKKALEEWKENNFGSQEGFEEAYGNDINFEKKWQEIFDNKEKDVY